MSIKIIQKFRPFSHMVGASCLLPKSFWKIEAFPTLVRFVHLQTHKCIEVPLELLCPIENFTLEVDLERGHVRLFGHSAQGYFEILIERLSSGIQLQMAKRPPVFLPLDEPFQDVSSQERLSLGVHKAQDWDLVSRRTLPEEFLPFWLRQSLFLPPLEKETRSPGTLALLEEAERLDKTEMSRHFQKTFRAGFSGILVPRLDDNHQGLIDEKTLGPSVNPLHLVAKGEHMIRALFFVEQGKELHLLPKLPPEFHAGRYTNIACMHGTLDLEWSKKLLRRAIFRAKDAHEIHLVLQKALKRFRLRRGMRERGTTCERDTLISVHAGETLYFDRFEK